MIHITSLPDFDSLCRLYQDDPDSYEQLRTQLLREAVESAPAHYRPSLELLLTKIEAARQVAATPIEAAQVAFRMMEKSVGQLADGWQQMHAAVAQWQAAMLIERLRY
jgi:hypothetical protein